MFTMPTVHFDETKIILNIGIISDVHIKHTFDEENSDKLRAALHQLRAHANTGTLDLLLAVGDMCNDGTAEQMEHLRRILSEQLDFDKTPLLYALGNHEWHTENPLAVKSAVFPDCAHGNPEDVAAGRQHITVGGYHFLSVDAAVFNKQEGIHYSAETVAWLDAKLAAITASAPDRYVFLQTHALIKDTVYGTGRGPFYQTEDLTEMLSRYPQLVTFGGHLHYPLNDERCIMQKAFTAVETASVSYMLIDGAGFTGIEKQARLPDRRAFSQGLLLQIDAAGALRLTRLDFYHAAVIKHPWLLPPPAADGAHLLSYSPRRGDADHSIPPALSGELSIEAVQNGEGEYLLRISHPAAVSPDMVRDYTVLLRDREAPEAEPVCFRFFSDFYRCPRIADMAKHCTLTLPPVAPGNYAVEVYAGDSWGGRSDSLHGTVHLPRSHFLA